MHGELEHSSISDGKIIKGVKLYISHKLSKNIIALSVILELVKLCKLKDAQNQSFVIINALKHLTLR